MITDIHKTPNHPFPFFLFHQGIPNLEALADNPKRRMSVSIDKKLLEQQTAAFLDNDDIDMDMRAPYIPMSGDEDLIFSTVPPIPLIDEMDCVS